MSFYFIGHWDIIYRQKTIMKNGIIFDLDGTLWDSSEEVVASWNEIIKKYKGDKYLITLEMMQGAMGLPMLVLGRKLWPDMPKEEMKKLLILCMEYENKYLLTHPGKLFPMVKETLVELKKEYPLYIVSNAQKGYIEAFLESTNLSELFEDHLCWGDTLSSKDVTMLKLKEKNNLDDAIYVGDTLGDEEATNKAKLHFVHAAYGFGKAKKPEAVLNNFSSLPSITQEIFSKRG